MNNITIGGIIMFVFIWIYILVSKGCKNIECNSDYAIYFIFATLFSFALIFEFIDLFCSEISIKCDDCGDGKSAKFKDFIANKNTTPQKAVQNVKNIIQQSNSFVMWRRYFISTALILLLLFLYKGKIFNCTDFIILFTLIFIVLQMIGNFYSYHYHQHIKNIINENLEILNKKNLINENNKKK